MTSFVFPSQLKLTNKRAYENVLKKGLKLEFNKSRLFVLENRCEHPRIGIIIAKKSVAKAVRRNKIRRVIKEYFRLSQHRLPNIDVVIIIGKPFDFLNKCQRQDQLNKLWQLIIERYPKASQLSCCG
jgi:ribonuclease P protein component